MGGGDISCPAGPNWNNTKVIIDFSLSFAADTPHLTTAERIPCLDRKSGIRGSGNTNQGRIRRHVHADSRVCCP